MRPDTGLLLGERYELLERIAVGGMGEVWQARDRHTGGLVAAKVLREELAGDERFLSRLRAEARNSAGLRHPNLAALLDHGEQERSGYLIMELVRGEPMSELLKRRSALEAATVLPVLAQTARALQVVHDAGVVHRDVKPSNILLTPDGGVKLTDFGISLGTDQAPMTAAGMVMGTAQYLPPEQAMGNPARPAGDIYALGVVAYEALAGHRPYTGPTQVDIAFAHVNQPLPPLPPSVPASVRTVVEQMLAKEPAARPATAAEVARTLEEVLADLRSRRWVVSVGTGTTAGGAPPGQQVASPSFPRASSGRSPRSGRSAASADAGPPPPPPEDPAQPKDPAQPENSAQPEEPPESPAPPIPTLPPTPAPARGRHRADTPDRASRRWDRPQWHQLAADRLWLRMVAVATLVAVVLGLATLGSLASADNATLGQSLGTPHAR